MLEQARKELHNLTSENFGNFEYLDWSSEGKKDRSVHWGSEAAGCITACTSGKIRNFRKIINFRHNPPHDFQGHNLG